MQTTKLMFIESATFILGSILDVLREPLVELIVRIEEGWHDEMQESPQLCVPDCIDKQLRIVENHAPCMEFCIGVPVKSKRFRQ